MDFDVHLRNELLKDVQARFKSFGEPPSAILISGDIGFGGAKEEYDFTLHWLEKELCPAAGNAPLSSVFVCPGNHDVLRSVAGSLAVKGLHDLIKKDDPLTVDMLMKNCLEDTTSGALLYKSIEAYNNFAVRFWCALTPPDKTMARRKLAFSDGSTLALWGLNSTFVSSETDKVNELFVDPSFSNILNENGVVNLVMCHHPFDWLRNGDILKDHLNDVAALQLFGHKHVSRIEQLNDCVRIASGSMQPERHKPGWQPGYNIIKLDVAGNGEQRKLNVEVHVLVLQDSPIKFVAKKTKNGEDVFSQSIILGPWQAPENSAPALDQTLTIEQKNDPMSSLREISIRFFKLSLSQRSEIAGKFGLLAESDAGMTDFIRFRNALVRAKEQGILVEVEKELKNFETGQE